MGGGDAGRETQEGIEVRPEGQQGHGESHQHPSSPPLFPGNVQPGQRVGAKDKAHAGQQVRVEQAWLVKLADRAQNQQGQGNQSRARLL
jgi:hypothetical protein